MSRKRMQFVLNKAPRVHVRVSRAYDRLVCNHMLLKRCDTRLLPTSYFHCPDHPDTRKRQLVLVRAAVGTPMDFESRIGRKLTKSPKEAHHRHASSPCLTTMTKPPKDASGKLFDSVKGRPHRPTQSGAGANDSVMGVPYDLAQAYPEYVTYTTA